MTGIQEVLIIIGLYTLLKVFDGILTGAGKDIWEVIKDLFK